ncbi:High-affinity copper transporter ctrA2 [Exophiala dermatitidis]
MDMSSSHSSSSSDSMSMSMAMVFTNSHSTPLFSNAWTPTSEGGYAGTCIFLLLLAVTLRLLFAAKALCEQRWSAAARNRRFVLVKGRSTEAGRIDEDPDAKTASLLTAQGVEENVKVVQARTGGTLPFRLSVDIPRAVLMTIIAGVSYLLMLGVMTMNVGYFLSVLAGTFVGELLAGRYAQVDEHLH